MVKLINYSLITVLPYPLRHPFYTSTLSDAVSLTLQSSWSLSC